MLRAPLPTKLNYNLAIHRQQQFLVLRGDQLIELVLAHRLGEKLGDAAIEVRQYVAQALRLATEGIPGVQIGIVVNLDERFEADTQALAVVQDAAVDAADRLPDGAVWVCPPCSARQCGL